MRARLCLSAICAFGVLLSGIEAPTAQTAEQVVRTGVGTTRLAAILQATEQRLPYVPGELLVRFRADATDSQRTRALQTVRGVGVESEERWIGDTLHMRSAAIEDSPQAAEVLSQQRGVLYAQPNYLRTLHSVPNDPWYGDQWNFQAINLPSAWEINPGGRSDVLVAVIDSGLTTRGAAVSMPIWDGRAFRFFPVPFSKAADFDHTRVRAGRDFTGLALQLVSGEELALDSNGHGTHVAGTIAQQTNNGLAYAGVAHQSALIALKACWSYWDLQLFLGVHGFPTFVPTDYEGGCDDAGIIESLRYAADQGAKVINISIGGPSPFPPALEDALRYAVSRGAFVSISAGNSALTGNPTMYPAALAASIEGVVAVGALSRDGRRAAYSSYGAYVELSAPGGDGIGPTHSTSIFQVAPRETDLDSRLLVPRFDRYEGRGISGTSMASPHVAGLAALLYSQGITSPAAIEAALKQTAKDLGSTGRDHDFGFGLIDARAALRGLGWGR